MKDLTPSHTNTRKERAQVLQAAIMRLLLIDEQQYANLQYETGLEYLQAYLIGSEFYAEQVTRSRIFWAWWKNHWTNRDEEFLKLNEHVSASLKELRKLYAEYNDGEALASCIHPNSIILNDSYVEMITEVVKESV